MSDHKKAFANFQAGVVVSSLGTTGALITGRNPKVGLVLGALAGLGAVSRFGVNAATSAKKEKGKFSSFLKGETAALAGTVGTSLLLQRLGGRSLRKLVIPKARDVARAGGQYRAQRAIKRGTPVVMGEKGVRFVRIRGRVIPIRSKK